MQSYLRQRVSDAGADASCLLPPRWDIKVYQGLGDSHSAAALCQDLLALVQQESSPPRVGLLAVFECAPACGGSPDFSASLATHLQLMHSLDARLGDVEMADYDKTNDDLQLQILGRSFRLIAMHADAERLSRVLPCPVLAFSAL
jgi:YqcI/YcgG family